MLASEGKELQEKSQKTLSTIRDCLEDNKAFDIIEIEGKKTIKPLNYNIPSDISSSAFFIVLTALSKNSKLKIKNININPTRIGVLKILIMIQILLNNLIKI